MHRDLENPMVQGDYYEQPKIYAVCSECGGVIYEGETFHLIGRGADCQKVCSECHRREVAVCDEWQP